MTEKISIIVPSYNEKDNIKPLLTRIHESLSVYDYEVIIVDDNSTDGTIETARGLTSTFPVKLLVRTEERGLSTAVIHGMRHAQGSIIGVMDADLQHPPEILPSLVKAIEDGADMVVGSRYIEGGGVPHWSALRKIISKGASMIAHLLLPGARQVKDPMSGFFMFRRENVDPDILKPIGYKIALEILLLGGFRKLAEVPYIFEDRSAGASKLKWSTQIEYLRHILSLMARTGEIKRILKFTAVGLTGVGVNQGLLWLLTDVAGLRYYISAIFSIEASIISNFVLNDYFTFSDRRAGKGTSFLGRMLKFNLTCATGALIQYGILILFTSVFGLHYLLSNLIGIAIAFVWNYFINSIWTWK